MPGFAQTITAGVNGTVTDASGAVIPNAKVTATNVDTNVSISTITTKDGIYVIRNLQIGQYKVTVESAGFAAKTLGPFTLESGQDAKLDFAARRGRFHKQHLGEQRFCSLVEHGKRDAGQHAGYERDRSNAAGWT